MAAFPVTEHPDGGEQDQDTNDADDNQGNKPKIHTFLQGQGDGSR